MRRSVRRLCAAGPFNPYKILGVSPDAPLDVIKKRHRELALKYHPDSPNGDQKRFVAVQEAYEAVKDGKWKPTAENAANGNGGRRGFDPATGMYTYEPPGSTTENYVSSDPELRRFLIFGLLFTVVVSIARLIGLQQTNRAKRREAERIAEQAKAVTDFVDRGGEPEAARPDSWETAFRAEQQTKPYDPLARN